MEEKIDPRDKFIIDCVKESHFVHRGRTWPVTDETNQLLARYIQACNGIPEDKIAQMFTEFDSERGMPKPHDIRGKFFQYERTRKEEEAQTSGWNTSEEDMYSVLKKAATSPYAKDILHLLKNINSYMKEDKKLDQDRYYGELKRISDKHGVWCSSVEKMKADHDAGKLPPFAPGETPQTRVHKMTKWR